MIALNLPSYDKYEPLIQKGGVLVVNASMVDRGAKRNDITTIFVHANEIAEEIGDRKLTNMVAVGALLAQSARDHPWKQSKPPSKPTCRNDTTSCSPKTMRLYGGDMKKPGNRFQLRPD